MIKIIHVYAKNDSMAANYVSMLTKAMKETTDMRSADDLVTFRQMCSESMPDIVHLHGTMRVPQGNYRLVLTAHGHPVDETNYYVVIARSKMEAARTEFPRVEIVKNPLITKTTTIDETAKNMLRIYQKVMDTNVIQLMNADTREALRMLLKAGICGDKQWVEKQMPLPQPDWRLLSIYAYFEQVSPIVRRGAQVLGIPMPDISVSPSTSYLPKGYHPLEEKPDSTVIALLHDIQAGQVTLLRFTEIDEALRREDMDEEKLLIELEDEKLKPLFSCVLQILSEQTLLDEGFMPCTPVDNQETQRLRTQLSRHMNL